MATVEVLAPAGLTLSLQLFPLGIDTQAALVALTEATNRAGLYTGSVSGEAGNYTVHVASGGALIGNGYLWLQDDSGTYRATSEADFLSAGEPGQETPSADQPLWRKIAFMFKFALNRADNDGSFVTLYNDSGVVVDQKAAVSDSGGVVTRNRLQSGP